MTGVDAVEKNIKIAQLHAVCLFYNWPIDILHWLSPTLNLSVLSFKLIRLLYIGGSS